MKKTYTRHHGARASRHARTFKQGCVKEFHIRTIRGPERSKTLCSDPVTPYIRLPVSVSVKNIYALYTGLERQGTLEFSNWCVSKNSIYAPYAGLNALRLCVVSL